jgi:hypothetical protein
MISDLESVGSAVRFLPGIKDIDIVKFPSGKQLWIVMGDPINLPRLRATSESFGYVVARRGMLVSKFPRGLAEMFWDGVIYVINKHTHVPGKSESAARIMKDLVTGDVIYHPIDGDGLKILQEYLKT